MYKKILILGAGGIGSMFSSRIYDLVIKRQININDSELFIADNDNVKLENIQNNQKFDKEDLMMNKAEAIAKKHGFVAIKKKIETEEELKDYDVFVICVDNKKARELIFNYCNKNPDKYFIDLRAEGRGVAVFTTSKENTVERLLETLPDDDESGSCQRKADKEQGIFQLGSVIIAEIGAQFLLNHLRGEINPPKFIQRF